MNKTEGAPFLSCAIVVTAEQQSLVRNVGEGSFSTLSYHLALLSLHGICQARPTPPTICRGGVATHPLFPHSHQPPTNAQPIPWRAVFYTPLSFALNRAASAASPSIRNNCSLKGEKLCPFHTTSRSPRHQLPCQNGLSFPVNSLILHLDPRHHSPPDLLSSRSIVPATLAR